MIKKIILRSSHIVLEESLNFLKLNIIIQQEYKT